MPRMKSTMELLLIMLLELKDEWVEAGLLWQSLPAQAHATPGGVVCALEAAPSAVEWQMGGDGVALYRLTRAGRLRAAIAAHGYAPDDHQPTGKE